MTHLRKNIWSLSETDPIVLAYGNAITAMRAKPPTDPTSWTYQAAIHGTYTDPPPVPLADECRHQTWYFAPWHRMYAYFFERIVRAEVVKAGGSADWALPYWDYDTTATNTLPLAFRKPTRPDGSPNPLYIQKRRTTPYSVNGGGTFPAAATSASFALSRTTYTGDLELGGGPTPVGTTFWGHTGRLEQTPHNDMHNQIGGPGGLMTDPATAAQDPIFWLHHANIDRLWWTWQQTHANPADRAWLDQEFSFYDENGKQVWIKCSAVLDTTTQLDYTYRRLREIRFPFPKPVRPIWPRWIPKEKLPVPRHPDQPPVPPGPGPDPGPEFVGASERPLNLVGRTERIPVVVDDRARRAVVGDGQARQVVLAVEDIDADVNPGTTYGVYVNLPDNASSEDLAAHHAGNVSFFGIERTRSPRTDDHAHGMRVAMDITDLVASLTERGQWDASAQVDVTFRPIELGPPEDQQDLEAAEVPTHEDLPVTIGRVSLHVR
jgi:tyrosinase